jgi:hypothetical protein
LIYRRRISITVHWRPLHSFSAVLPRCGALTLLRVPLAVFKKPSSSVKSVDLIYRIESSELERFRDAIVDFYEDFAMLTRVGFPVPQPEDLADTCFSLHAVFTWPILATIAPDGIGFQSDFPLFAKVTHRFRKFFDGSRNVFRRASELMLSIAKLSEPFAKAVCEIIGQTQGKGWCEAIDWVKFFDHANFNVDEGHMFLVFDLKEELLEIELIGPGGAVKQKQFSSLRQFIQRMTEGCFEGIWEVECE